MRRLYAIALLAVALLTGCTAGGDETLPQLTVTFLSVGKADCILLEADGHAAMIDTGNDGDADDILALLSKKGIVSLDFLLLTHMDKDHIGGADAILDQLEIGTVYAPDYVKDNKQYNQYVEALDAAGIVPVNPEGAVTLPFGGGTLTLLPGAKAEYEQSNDYSILAELQYGDTSFLFAGDAETERLKEYLAGSPRTFDVLKVPHHGRADALSEAFFTVVAPKYAVITCSEKNMPEESVVSFLKSLGAQVHGTALGDVILTSDGKAVKVA